MDDQYLRVMGAATLSLATDVIFIIDPTTLRVTLANLAFTRVLGYTAAEVPRISLRDLIAADQASIDQNLARLTSQGEIFLGARPYRRRDGSITEMESRVGVTAVDGRTLYCVVARDLTEIRLAEGSLRESQERFKTLADVAFEGIAITEAGRIVDVNRRCSEILGVPPADLLGRSVSEFVAPESRETVAQHLRSGSEAPYEHLALRADGSRVPVEVQAKNATIGGRHLRVTALRDVSERQRLEEQFRLAQRMESIGRLAGGVAHDFNNLLTVILSLTKLLQEAPKDHSIAGDLAQIQAAAERASELTQQLLTFARRQIAQPEVIDLNGLVTNLDSMLHRIIGEDITLNTVCARDLGRVRADPGQVEQVLLNLVVNARDAMPAGGKLTLETANVTLGDDYASAPGEYVMVSVADTGVGMDAATLAKIFEPFFTTKAPGKGTGLGLATCYGIVKQSGGSISVYSEVGKGTIFKIYLPRVWDAAASRERPASTAAVRGSETVLVVEDNDLVRLVASRILAANGYQVLEAADGSAALRLFAAQQGRIALVMTDLILPEMTGRELADKLRMARPDLKIVYTSGYTENTIVHQGMVDAGVHFLPKPYLPAALLEKIRAVLDGA
jgi:two-component system cell cycle sensor histidine kinase/response regulator CckA